MHESESEVAQSCPTPSNPMDCSLPGSSVHGIFQARVLEWGAIAFSEKNIYFCFIDYAKVFDCVGHTNCGKYLKRWEYQTTLPASWETWVQLKKQQNRTWNNRLVPFGKGVYQGCILSPCLFNFYAEYIMWNAGLDDPQAGIKIAGRNINNLRYADETTLTVESKEELKSILKKVKEESEKMALKRTLKKWRSWHPVPSLHGQ